MTSVKRFFGKLFKFIKESVWLQPVLIVGLIFAVIFSLGGISDFFNNVGKWFQGGNSGDTEVLKLEKLTQEEILEKYLKGEKFAFIIVQDNCHYCEEYYVSLNQYKKQLDEDENFNGGVKFYALDVTRIDGEYRDDTIETETYKEWYDRIAEGTGEYTKWTGKSAFNTPTTVFVENQQVIFAQEGPIKYSQLNTFVNFYFSE